ERDHIRKRIELHAERAGAARHTGDAPVEHVEDEREADKRRRSLVVAAHRIHDADVAAEHIAEREQAGKQVDAPPQARARPVAGAAEEAQARALIEHQTIQCSTAMTVSPPRTVSSTLTVMLALGGTKMSIRDPNFIIP